jgi:hypothetical protein
MLPPPTHQADLHAGVDHLADVLGHRLQGLGIDAETLAADAGLP